MEALESLNRAIQASVEEHVNDTKEAFAQQWESHQAAFDAERESYRDQIEALNVRLNELEGHNRRDTARHDQRLDADTGEKIAPDNALLERLRKVEAEYELCRKDFGRVRGAKELLETRLREYKEMQREWNTYYRKWIARHPRRRTSNKGMRTPEQSEPTVEQQSSGCPMPPGYATASSEYSGSSRPTSSHREVARTAKDVPTEEDPPSNGLQTTQSVIRREQEAGLDDLAETCDDPKTRQEIEPHIDTKDTDAPSDLVLDQARNTGGSSPVVVSERTLKRKRTAKEERAPFNIHQDPSKPDDRKDTDRLKAEVLSSSPLQPSKFVNHQHHTGDSLDLDEVGGTLYTPRKRQRMEEAIRTSSMNADEETQDEDTRAIEEAITNRTALPGPMHQASHSVDENGMPTDTDSADEDERLRRARKQAQLAQQHAYNERVHAKRSLAKSGNAASPHTPNSKNHRPGRRSHYPDPSRSPAIRGNRPLPRTGDCLTSEKRQPPSSRSDHGAAAVPFLAEDGEETAMPKSANTAPVAVARAGAKNAAMPRKRTSKSPKTHDRLGQLLNNPSPEKAPLAQKSHIKRKKENTAANATPTMISLLPLKENFFLTPQTVPATRSATRVDSISKSAQPLPSKHRNPQSRPRKSTPTTDQQDDPQPDDGPLRARPLHRLTMEDFKLNPNHSNYAYHESLRRHDEKKARGGCTDPFCQRCKDLAKFISASGFASPLPTTTTTTTGTSTTPKNDSASSDEALLKSYLGRSYHSTLSSASPAEKQELLTKARTQAFKDRFGKHRQTFSKPPEPPGFWDTDFPSTQENEVLREEARIMERQKVEERRAEALRGGMWVFADEVGRGRR